MRQSQHLNTTAKSLEAVIQLAEMRDNEALKLRTEDYIPPIDISRLGRTRADAEIIRDPAQFSPKHFDWKLESGVGTITLTI